VAHTRTLRTYMCLACCWWCCCYVVYTYLLGNEWRPSTEAIHRLRPAVPYRYLARPEPPKARPAPGRCVRQVHGY
jgi:hypothetical protein